MGVISVESGNMSMIYAKVRTTATLPGGPSDYFSVVSDIENWFKWNSNFLHASLDGPFEQGARGIAVPALYKTIPVQVSRVVYPELIQFDFFIPLGKVRSCYRFSGTGENVTEVTVSMEIRSVYGWLLFFFKAKGYRSNLEQALKKLEIRVAQMPQNIAS